VATVKLKKKEPAGGAGNYKYTYECVCTSGKKAGDIVVTAANDNEAKRLAQMDCDEKCGEG